ncbi:MAG: hypothetical protein Q8L88_00690 [Bacteroidota bacterium]|nr:hypothetical protein [Bacteroidota bacterium]
MQEHLLNYFTAEKQESLFFILVGAAAIVVSIFLWKNESSYKPMIYPLIAIALIQIIVGGTIYFRTDSQIATLSKQFQEHPAQYRTEETARMTTVNNNFTFYKYIEITLLSIGIILTFAVSRSNDWYAVGIGLIIQSGLMLVMDLFAERRAHEYVEKIQELIQ